MTSSDSTTPPAPAGPDRAVPQQLVDLAVLAIRRGAQRVSLLHEGMSADFGAPIGWLLRFHKTEDPDHSDSGKSAFFDHQVGCDLGDIVAPGWLAEIGEDQPVIEELVELFQMGAKNGWDVSYERRELDHSFLQRIAEKDGSISVPGLRHRFEATATNWHYDQTAHDSGDPVSTTLTLSLCEGERPILVAFADDGGNHRPVDREHIAALIHQQAPNAAPVAYFDEELDRWVR